MVTSILHITGLALRGGCEKNCYHFIEGTPHVKNEIMVLGDRGPMTAQWENIGVTPEHLSILSLNMLAFHQHLKRKLAGRKYDVIICWSTIRLSLQLNACNNMAGRVIVHLGNPLAASYKPVKDIILGFLFPAHDAVKLMACSAYVATSHANNPYFGKFPIGVSLNPVSLPVRWPEKKLDQHHFRLGMVARLDPIKDHRTVLIAFKDILRARPDAELHLVGDGILRRTLEQIAATENIAHAVYFHGDVADVYRYLNEWDIFVYATTMMEGLGSAVTEAMANGLPCVLSDLPMLRELAPDERIALWFPFGNSVALAEQVKRLADDEGLRERKSRAAWQHAHEHFGIQHFVNDYLKN